MNVDTLATYRNPEGARGYLEKEKSHHEKRSKIVYTLLDQLDLHGANVLDIGCGFGRDVGEFRRRGANAIGVDGSAPLLAEARQRHGNEGFYEADILWLENPPEGKRFDLIWSCAFLVHVPRALMPVLLAHWATWLKPGGRLVLITKHGEGEQIYSNLGEHLPRLMVYYRPEELLQALPGTTVEMNFVEKPASTVDEMLNLRVRKES